MAVSKTEQEMRETVARRGFWHVTGKRAFDLTKRLEELGKLDGLTASYGCHNANGVFFKNQWNCPRPKLVYEVVVRACEPAITPRPSVS